MAKVKKAMPVKGIRDTEKIAVGAIRTAIQTWLAPELRNIGERLTHVEVRLDALERRVAGLEKRMDDEFKSLRGEVNVRFETVDKRFETIDKRFETIDKRFETIDKHFETIEKRIEEGFRATRNEFAGHFDAIRAELRRLDTVADFRERLATLEAKVAQQG